MTIRPLSSRVIFVAPRNMTRQGESRPFPPTFSHWAPLWNRGRAMSIQNSEKFVAFTKTYVEALMSGITVSQSREAHSVLTISGLAGEPHTVIHKYGCWMEVSPRRIRARAQLPADALCDITRNPHPTLHLESRPITRARTRFLNSESA